MYVNIKVDEKEIRKQVTIMIRDILQKEITMRWIREVVTDEVKKQVKIDIKVNKRK